MALRTIADLPALNVDKIIGDPNLITNISESIFEVSYIETIDKYDSYKSKHVKFKGLSNLMLNDIVNNDFTFYGLKTFQNGINVLSFLNLSGDLYVNNMAPENWGQYETIINAGTIQLNTLNMQLSSTDNFNIYTDNGYIRNTANTELVNWNSDNFNIKIPLNVPNISCTSITAGSTSNFKGHVNFDSTTQFNGTATFKKDIQGCAVSARWADLAELYQSDNDYEPGTLIKFGGSAEITIADDKVNAVITNKPGFILNTDENKIGIYKGIALVGRTPVKVMGPVKKFDRLTLNSNLPGTAKKIENLSENVIAIAFEDISSNDIQLIECVVQLNLN